MSKGSKVAFAISALWTTEEIIDLIYDGDESFQLYIDIASKSCNGIPKDVLNNNIFKEYRIKKKFFPKKNTYNFN